jgi:hypothetical protein
MANIQWSWNLSAGVETRREVVSKMRKLFGRSAIIMILLFMVAGVQANWLWATDRTTADDEADVFNTGAGNVNPTPSPGDNFVVIADVTIADPGFLGDTVPDGHPTAIETITIRKTVGSTLADRFISALRIYVDNGDGLFNLPDDALLGQVINPDLTNGVRFGTPGELLILVPDDGLQQFFVVADFTTDAPDNATLRVSFEVTVSDGLRNGPPLSSGIDLATELPLLSFDKGLPQPTGFITITATRGRKQTDVVDITPALVAHPGAPAVIQQFRIADPGVSGDATPDGYATLVRAVVVKKVEGTLDTSRIKKLKLYRESGLTGPGWQPEDELLAEVNQPDLVEGVTFTMGGGQRLLRVADGREEVLYVVAEPDSVGFVDGDTLRTQVTIIARDDKIPNGEISSGIETSMPLIATNRITIGVPPPQLIIGSATIVDKGKIPISIRFVPEPGLGELQIGPDGAIVFDPEIIQVVGVRGVGPYSVTSRFIDSIEGRVQFTLTLKPGRKALNEGVIAELEIERAPDAPVGSSIELRIEDLDGIEVVDVFRDAAGNDIVPDVLPGVIKIKLLKGDVDGDGAVTISDARLVARFILGLETLIPEQEEAADVAPPLGVIDATDVRWIAQAAAGLRKLKDETARLLAMENPVQGLSLREGLGSGPFRVTGVQAQQSRSLLKLHIQGWGITAVQLDLYGLNGHLFQRAETGGAGVLYLPLQDQAGRPLARGVYLYKLTVIGVDGRYVSEVRKLVLR